MNEKLLCLATPWPMPDVVAKLVQATQHLLRDHDCDAHGWEEYRTAAAKGAEYVEALKRIAEHPAAQVAGDRLETTVAQFILRAQHFLIEEQEKPNPDNALVGFLCDAVRVAREHRRQATAPLAESETENLKRLLRRVLGGTECNYNMTEVLARDIENALGSKSSAPLLHADMSREEVDATMRQVRTCGWWRMPDSRNPMDARMFRFKAGCNGLVATGVHPIYPDFCPGCSRPVRILNPSPNDAVRWICPICTTANDNKDERCCVGSCKGARPNPWPPAAV